MSKLRLRAISLLSSSLIALTKYVDPSSPISSALQKANSTRLKTAMPLLIIWRAISRLAAEPLLCVYQERGHSLRMEGGRVGNYPLSFMPGPAATESKCDPNWENNIIILSKFFRFLLYYYSQQLWYLHFGTQACTLVHCRYARN